MQLALVFTAVAATAAATAVRSPHMRYANAAPAAQPAPSAPALAAHTLVGYWHCLAQGIGCDSIRPSNPYPTVRGVMTWSINWDRFDNFAFSKNARKALDSLPLSNVVGTTTTEGRRNVPSRTPESRPRTTTRAPAKNCGRCSNCYFAPTAACFKDWTATQCNSVSAFTWCGP
ncbi:hypothetical protein AeMF1_004792 [Aphanomyces euteiches]|nr:hypothetical protein AeMF1_004792 [Aphanomyces euteiches]